MQANTKADYRQTINYDKTWFQSQSPRSPIAWRMQGSQTQLQDLDNDCSTAIHHIVAIAGQRNMKRHTATETQEVLADTAVSL